MEGETLSENDGYDKYLIGGGLFVTAVLTGVLASGKYKAKSKTISAEMKADPYHPDWKSYSGTDRGVGADRVNAESGPKAIDNSVIGKPRTGSANKLPDGQHGFNDIIDNYAGDAAKFEIPTKGPGGEVVRVSELRQIEGSNNGEGGVFEWIVDEGKVTNRRFIPSGQVTGLPNHIPKK